MENKRYRYGLLMNLISRKEQNPSVFLRANVEVLIVSDRWSGWRHCATLGIGCGENSYAFLASPPEDVAELEELHRCAFDCLYNSVSMGDTCV